MRGSHRDNSPIVTQGLSQFPIYGLAVVVKRNSHLLWLCMGNWNEPFVTHGELSCALLSTLLDWVKVDFVCALCRFFLDPKFKNPDHDLKQKSWNFCFFFFSHFRTLKWSSKSHQMTTFFCSK